MPKVLLVEDDPLIIRLYQKTLKFAGYDVQSANNGLEALEQLPAFQPDVILLDIMMPEMNGVQFLNKMNSGSGESKIPVIVLTNIADSDVTLSAVSAGAALILIKSQTEPDDVVTAIKRVLAREILQTESLESVEPTEPQQDRSAGQ
jgi:CheY-like chemotaxis protein